MSETMAALVRRYTVEQPVPASRRRYVLDADAEQDLQALCAETGASAASMLSAAVRLARRHLGGRARGVAKVPSIEATADLSGYRR